MPACNSAIAIRNARIVTVSRPRIPRGTVVLRNGLIEAVGCRNVHIPADAWVIEGDGLTVYPGLIDASQHAGNARRPFTASRAVAVAAGAVPPRLPKQLRQPRGSPRARSRRSSATLQAG